jgi:MscS family membrane protein
MDNMNDAVRAYQAGDREKAKKLVERPMQCLNLEKLPPALRYVVGFHATIYLKERLDRIEIPPYDDIPDAKAVY